jgi:hypothetical protein
MHATHPHTEAVCIFTGHVLQLVQLLAQPELSKLGGAVVHLIPLHATVNRQPSTVKHQRACVSTPCKRATTNLPARHVQHI